MTENEFLQRLYGIRDGLPGAEARSQFDHHFFTEMKNPLIQYGYNYFLGWFGVDHFTLGRTVEGVIKLALGLVGIIGIIYGAASLATYADHAWAVEPASLSPFLWVLPITLYIIVDYFRMPGLTRRWNATLAEKTAASVLADAGIGGLVKE